MLVLCELLTQFCFSQMHCRPPLELGMLSVDQNTIEHIYTWICCVFLTSILIWHDLGHLDNRYKEGFLCYPQLTSISISVSLLTPFSLSFIFCTCSSRSYCRMDGWKAATSLMTVIIIVCLSDRRWRARKAASQLARQQGCGNKCKLPRAPRLHPTVKQILCKLLKCHQKIECESGVFSSLGLGVNKLASWMNKNTTTGLLIINKNWASCYCSTGTDNVCHLSCLYPASKIAVVYILMSNSDTDLHTGLWVV